MIVEQVVFWLAAVVVLGSALMVVVNRHPVYSALSLVGTFLGLAVLYYSLQAPFIAVVQVIVYAGAIMVLFLFVIMLLNEDRPLPSGQRLGWQIPLAVLLVLVLALELGSQFRLLPASARETSPRPGPVTMLSAPAGQSDRAGFGSVQAVGNTLFTRYLFAFEATSIVLLVAMVGVVALAKKRL